MKLCDYGCGNEAKFLFKNGKWCCEKIITKCIEVRRKNGSKKIGVKRPQLEKLI